MAEARRLSRILLWACALAAGTACTTHSRSQARAQAAFRAGETQALVDVAQRQNGILFTGPVANPVIPWKEGLTLGEAVAAAGWMGKTDPRRVVFVRDGESVQMSPEELLQAAQFPVNPGDRVDLIP